MTRILIVDDDSATRETLHDVLADEGYDVANASDGSAALKYLRTGRRPDAILLDLAMAPMNGLEFRQAQLADARFANIPVVAFTAQTIRCGDRLEGIRVVQKPADLRVLLGAISALFEVTQHVAR